MPAFNLADWIRNDAEWIDKQDICIFTTILSRFISFIYW